MTCSKTDRKICGTCEFWNGDRNPTFDKNGKPKVQINSKIGECENPNSRFHMDDRENDRNCKYYSKWTELF